ncbi:TIGR00295 family protein [Methanocaldococcus indicus]|uniref:TIGR00295 family protein n=1 Tax=Methanocaldococcus indicus TaxID=213231 RepID=UPI003C6D162C
MMYLKALKILEELCPKDVVKHCIAVSNYAYELSLMIKSRGYKIDAELVKLGGLLHDIGRSETHSIKHGVVGAKILRELGFDERIALIAERHIGAGLTKKEALKFGLPYKDYIPITIEEKVVAHADNLIFGDKRVEIDKVVDKFKKRGANKEVILRIIKLNDEINSFLK